MNFKSQTKFELNYELIQMENKRGTVALGYLYKSLGQLVAKVAQPTWAFRPTGPK
jgi:hypothetical protein